MFTLRRASNHFRSRLHCGLTALAAAPPQSYHTQSNILLHQIPATESNNIHHTHHYHRNIFTFRGFNSQSDSKCNKEEELQEKQDKDDGEDLEDGLINKLEDPSTEEEDSKAEEQEEEEVRSVPFDLFDVVASTPPRDVYATLDKFMEEIKALDHAQISLVLRNLSRCKMYELALQLSNWLESKDMFHFEEERDYAIRLDLIAKRRGTTLAEKYLQQSIPETFMGKTVYETMLSNYVSVGELKKAEQMFEKMRDLGFPLGGFSCQQMILLYKKFDKKKIQSVLSLMEENDVKPTRFIYRLLIDLKGAANDIAGMEELVEALKSDGLELDNHIRGVLARHYI